MGVGGAGPASSCLASGTARASSSPHSAEHDRDPSRRAAARRPGATRRPRSSPSPARGQVHAPSAGSAPTTLCTSPYATCGRGGGAINNPYATCGRGEGAFRKQLYEETARRPSGTATCCSSAAPYPSRCVVKWTVALPAWQRNVRQRTGLLPRGARACSSPAVNCLHQMRCPLLERCSNSPQRPNITYYFRSLFCVPCAQCDDIMLTMTPMLLVSECIWIAMQRMLSQDAPSDAVHFISCLPLISTLGDWPAG